MLLRFNLNYLLHRPWLMFVACFLVTEYVVNRLKGKAKNSVAYVVALEVVEKQFAQSFLEALQSLRLNPKMYHNKKKGKRQDTYYVKAYSKRFYQWWTKQTLVGFEETFFNEALLLKEFVRGFFESEGSYYKRDYPYYQTFCQMVNTELAIVHLFKKALAHLSFKTSIHRHEEKRKGRKKFVYKLWILGGKNEHNRFIKLIKPCIKNYLH